MRFKLVTILLTAALLAGCQQTVYIVVSPTPDPTEIAAVTAEVTPEVTEAATEAPTEEATPEVTAAVQAATTIPTSAVTPADMLTGGTTPHTETPAAQTPSATQLPPNFPTPIFQQIQVAEQLFENGRMFWLQPTGQIWVLNITSEGRGTWTVYEDTFVDGEPENDPSLVPPQNLLQPERGFGKLWREVEGIREALGWAATPEFGYVSRYEYHAGGEVDAQGNFQPGFGYHVLYSLYGEQFRFNEADSTWQLGGG